jgi:hypothetical protein
LAGTDVPCGLVPPGRGIWQELALLCAAGLAPVQALRAATSAAAAFLGQPDLGRLKPGARADLVLVRGDPVEDLTRPQGGPPDIALVVRNGEVFWPARLRAEFGLHVTADLAGEPWAVQFRQHWEKQAREPGDGKAAPAGRRTDPSTDR